MFVELYDRSKERVAAPAMTPERYSIDAIGGPKSAMIAVNSNSVDLLRYVGYFVIIKNDNGTPVWWGKVEEVLLDADRLQIGASQRELRNRIAVLFNYIDGDGSPVPVETSFAQNDRSVAAYGRFEERHSLGEASATQAGAVRDRALADLAFPRPSLRINRSGGKGATLRCVGLWDTLKQTYYKDSTGLIAFTDSHTTELVLGWALTSNQVGFTDKSVQAPGGGFDAFHENDKINISGSFSNDGNKTVFGVGEKPRTYVANTIGFDATDDVTDTANGFGFIKSGNYFKVTGSAAHSRWHLADEVGRGHIATDDLVTGTIANEAAGPAITIYQPWRVDLVEDVVTEQPAQSVTITAHGVKVAYSVPFFTSPEAEAFQLGEVWVKMRRNGQTSDDVKVEFCTDSSGAPGTVLDSATIPGNSLITRMAWVKFTMTSVATVTPGSTYWIVISRTGANNAQTYYTVGITEDLGHAGNLRLWTGSAWATRVIAASVPFQLWGHTTATTQIYNILSAEGQYFRQVFVRYTTTVTRRQYHDGTLSAYEELLNLLNVGARLLPRVTPEWHIIIEPLPSVLELQHQIGRNGKLTDLVGKPLEQGVLPVGQWCKIDGIPDNIDALAPISPFIIGSMEWDAKRNELADIAALDSDSVWDIGGVSQG